MHASRLGLSRRTELTLRWHLSVRVCGGTPTGFYLVGAMMKSPQEQIHRGIFYQDRKTFPSDIKIDPPNKRVRPK